MADFTPARIAKVMKRLETQARRIERNAMLLGALLGSAPGIMSQLDRNPGEGAMLVLAIGVVLGGAIGLAIGKSRAFMIRVEADKLHLLLLLEERTRVEPAPAPEA
jgi:hypothetical protein